MMHKMVNGVQVELTAAEEAEILAQWAEYDAKKNRYNYIALRVAAYASIEEQLDMQYKDEINGTHTWLDHITDVKARYPKPIE